MKIGDMVRWKNVRVHGTVTGVVVSELRHGVNASFVDVLVNEEVVPVNWKALEVIREYIEQEIEELALALADH